MPVDGINKIALGALGLARAISSDITAVHLTDDREQAEEFRGRWNEAVPDIPLLIIESLEQAGTGRRITVVLPSFVAHHWWERLLHNRDAVRLRPFLEHRPDVRIVDFPYELEERRAAPPASGAPAQA